MANATTDRVKRILIDMLGVDEEEVTPEASIQGDLGADSLDTIELIMALETEFNRSIPDEDAQKLTTVAEIVIYIDERLQKEALAGA